MEKEFIFLRHGETEWNKLNRYQGSLNIGLNERGREQARQAASLLEETREIDLIVSSDLDRARDTASVVGERMGLEVQLRQDLREMDFGIWEGKDYPTIQEESPEAYQKWLEDPVKNPPPEGESLVDFKERVVGVCQEILEREEEDVLIVCHGGVIMAYLAHILGMDLRDYRRLRVSNAGISQVSYYERQPVLHTFNCTNHLS